mmetsp:Transcript_1631/g.4115  ORF Transcript_1631/g.4115 Transcript_1631/m.4115 type:complete len:262 (+) Transcript_1631:55-840(+)
MATASVLADDNVADVPGCNCEASMCKKSFHDISYNLTTMACAFGHSDSDNFWGSIDDESEPVCDTLLKSEDFQDTYGVGATTWDYYPSGPLPVTLFSGTCDESIKEQLSCKSGGYTTIYNVRSKGCFTASRWLPGTNSTMRWGVSCASSYDTSIATSYDDQLSIFVETEFDKDVPLCDVEIAPVLSSRDWIEPAEGRRYMCYEFVDPKDSSATYSLLTISLGNEPCRGPKPTEPDINSVGLAHISRGFGLLVAVAIALIRV